MVQKGTWEVRGKKRNYEIVALGNWKANQFRKIAVCSQCRVSIAVWDREFSRKAVISAVWVYPGIFRGSGSVWNRRRVKSVVRRTFVRDGEWLPRADDNAGLWKLGWTRRAVRCDREQMTGLGLGIWRWEISLRLKKNTLWNF